MQNQSKAAGSEWTIRKVLSWTTSYFKSHNIESPKSDAAILLAHALETERIDVYLQCDKPLYADERSRFKTLIRRRISREPVAYIVGEKGFWSMNFTVTKNVLIPRPDTESLVEAAMSVLPDSGPQRILELGTGSGAIILSLASERPHCLFFASDRSAKALDVARENAERHHLDESVHFFSGDWFRPLKNDMYLFDMIISNPPYIPTAVISRLQPEICKYEPAMALDGGRDGLDSYRVIISSAHAYLADGGSLLLETGHNQKDGIQKIADACGCYENVIFTKDYGGHDRVVRMTKRERIKG
ncbi:MAG TPA: peptide chain release factor N(5)-glutamine methyltransferase [Desulfobacterales bacterium]|nr:MAG: peptide chain release factor N(5)-glutamine methyltransferase [Deltaproteobacteria bacterium]HHC24694.1 peptide chain release factor N(5)-glutamine methyltransferase [Desulfobacterales bacterium]